MGISVTTSPEQLRDELRAIFPDYIFQPEDDESQQFTHHRLLLDFISFYSAGNMLFTARQRKCLGKLVNEAVDAGGQLENAFGTCFLEHLGQVNAQKPLVTFLSPASKRRLHA